MFLLLALVAEPHADLFWEKVQFLSDSLDDVAIGTRVLLEVALERGLGLRSEHGASLPLPAGHHRTTGTRRVGRIGIFRLLEPFFEDKLDGSCVGGTKLHLFEATDGALRKIAVTLVGKRLANGSLGESKTNPLVLELFGKSLKLGVLWCHL